MYVCIYIYIYICSGKRRSDVEGGLGVPFKGSCKRVGVREGEGGTSLEEGPCLGVINFMLLFCIPEQK